MMPDSIPALIAVFFAILLMALVLALIFSPDFRSAVLGNPGEASIGGIITVKGVAIVLLCALFIGAILYALEKLPEEPDREVPTGPFNMRLNVHFEPNEVNPANPQVNAAAFIKTPQGVEPIPIVTKLSQGAVSVTLEIPDMETPFFIVFETPRGTWKTDDHSVWETVATARKQQGLTPP